MTIHTVYTLTGSLPNWPTLLVKAIEAAKDGDTIEVDTPAMQELGERARQRICPEKQVELVVAT